MTSACREACCSVTPRRTVSELFERGFRRNRAAPLPIEGAQLTDAEGNGARFSIDIADGKIAGVGFRASSCATLIAYCEFIAEIVPGLPSRDRARIDRDEPRGSTAGRARAQARARHPRNRRVPRGADISIVTRANRGAPQ